jgi:hypothetical protein
MICDEDDDDDDDNNNNQFAYCYLHSDAQL